MDMLLATALGAPVQSASLGEVSMGAFAPSGDAAAAFGARAAFHQFDRMDHFEMVHVTLVG